MQAGLRNERIVFQRATVSENTSGDQIKTWSDYLTVIARVRFGTAQEKREAAQEGGVQSASFECLRTPLLDAVTLKDRISFDGSDWDITERAPLDRKLIRFTATRVVI